ncbi:MAG: hypothetical protein IKB30_00740 [Clostridia bacterium]|nr:hypothetical protein [Clostridia bacterium]
MFKYHLRLQLPPTLDFNERLNNMLDFCKKAKVDDVMFFVGCEELNTGHITIEEAKKYTDVISRASKYLKEMGITVSLNPWMTLGHYDGSKSLKYGQNFRTMVGHDGVTAKVCVCPNCENWRKYYVDLMNFYVEAVHPDVIWIEDDFRLAGHGVEIRAIDQGCFCDECMARYNAKLSANYDRETFVSLLATDLTVRKAYLDVCRETMEGFLQYLTDNVKGQKRFGHMSGGTNFSEARRYSKFFEAYGSGGREKPLNRIGVSVVRQVQPQYCGRQLAGALLNRYLTGDTADCVTEIENNPHTYYTNSVYFNRFRQLYSVPTMLLKGSTWSIFEFNGNGCINYDRIANMYAEIKPYLSKIESLNLSPFDANGVVVLANEDVAYTAKINGDDYIRKFSDDTCFFMKWLPLIGINCHFSTDKNLKGKVVAVSPQVLRSLTTEQITALFKYNAVIINGNGVETLFELGLNHLIDAKSYTCYRERYSPYTFEQAHGDVKIQGITKMRATSNYSAGNYVKIEYGDKDKTVYTDIMTYDETVFGNGITKVGNALIISQKESGMYPHAIYHPLREYAIKTFIKDCGNLNNETFFIEQENVAPYSYVKDGKTILACVNFSDDCFPALDIYTGKQYKNVKIFTVKDPEGHTANLSYKDGVYTLNEELPALESYLLTLED